MTGNHDNERQDPPPTTSTVLLPIAAQAGWKVLSLASNEAKPVNWQTISFDDTAWASHTSVFSYGETSGTDDNTVDYGGVDTDKDPVYLCRYVLNLDTSTITNDAAVYCQFEADGGATIRVNGVSVMEYNRVYSNGSWPDGDLGCQQSINEGSSGTGYDVEGNRYGFYIPSSLLVNGDNIITAEVYQELQPSGLVTSSDMRFGFGMEWTTDMPSFRTHGFGSGFLQYMPYITELDGGNSGSCYTVEVGHIKYHHLDSGWDSSQDFTHPSFCTEDSYQAEWLRQALDSTKINFVVIHHSPVSLSSGRGYSELNWLTEVDGLHGLIVGHDHQDYLIENTDNEFIVLGTSLVGRTNRSNNGLQTTAAGTWNIVKTHDNTTPAIINCITSGSDGEGGLGYQIEKIRSSAPDQGTIVHTFQKRISIS